MGSSRCKIVEDVVSRTGSLSLLVVSIVEFIPAVPAVVFVATSLALLLVLTIRVAGIIGFTSLEITIYLVRNYPEGPMHKCKCM